MTFDTWLNLFHARRLYSQAVGHFRLSAWHAAGISATQAAAMNDEAYLDRGWE